MFANADTQRVKKHVPRSGSEPNHMEALLQTS